MGSLLSSLLTGCSVEPLQQAEFIKKVRTETKDPKLSGGRADRLWTHMLDLLDNGGVRFTDEGLT